jgi:DNA-binding response OmpR family regulator
MQILFITDNENIKKSVYNCLYKSYPPANIKNLNLSEEIDFSPARFSLIIFDISGLSDWSASAFSSTEEKLKKSSLPVLFIANSFQNNLVLKLTGKFLKECDFIFAENIVSELSIRVDVIIEKMNSSIPQNSIKIDDLVLDLDKYELKVFNIKIELTFKEYELLKLLLENPNKVFSRTKLLSMVWGYDFYGGSRTVDVHMRRLRSKLDLPYSDMLKTVRNVGYMFSM